MTKADRITLNPIGFIEFKLFFRYTTAFYFSSMPSEARKRTNAA